MNTTSPPKAPETPAPEEPKEPEVDISAIEAEVTKNVTDKLLKSLTGGSEEDLAKATGEKSPWAKEGRNPRDYDEIAEWTTQLALKKQAELKAEEDKENKRKEEEAGKFQQERATAFNKYWDNQLNELFEAGKLPKIEDEKNENDPGIRARKSLFSKISFLLYKSSLAVMLAFFNILSASNFASLITFLEVLSLLT